MVQDCSGQANTQINSVVLDIVTDPENIKCPKTIKELFHNFKYILETQLSAHRIANHYLPP